MIELLSGVHEALGWISGTIKKKSQKESLEDAALLTPMKKYDFTFSCPARGSCLGKCGEIWLCHLKLHVVNNPTCSWNY